MKAAILKALLKDVPDDAVVVLHGEDHAYTRLGQAKQCQAELYRGGELLEYYDWGNKSDKESPLVKVLVLE